MTSSRSFLTSLSDKSKRSIVDEISVLLDRIKDWGGCEEEIASLEQIKERVKALCVGKLEIAASLDSSPILTTYPDGRPFNLARSGRYNVDVTVYGDGGSMLHLRNLILDSLNAETSMEVI